MKYAKYAKYPKDKKWKLRAITSLAECKLCKEIYNSDYIGKCFWKWHEVICRNCLIDARREIKVLGIKTDEHIANKLLAERLCEYE